MDADSIRCLLVDHLNNMVKNPKLVDVDYAEHLIDQLIDKTISDNIESLCNSMYNVFACDWSVDGNSAHVCSGFCNSAISELMMIRHIRESVK